jgi:putative ABC transport system permease protein
VALAFVAAANDWIAAQTVRESGEVLVFALDARVLAFTLGACLLTAVGFGVGPAAFALRLDPNRMLKSGSRGATLDRGHQRVRNALVVSQFALAMTLLAGAGLFARGVQDAKHREYGWETDQLVSGSIVLPPESYETPAAKAEVQRQLQQRLAALPGVASASVSHSLPFLGLGENQKLRVAGREASMPGQEPSAATNATSPDYFATLGVPVLAGRDFDPTDGQGSRPVLIVNEALARGLFPEGDAVGRRLGLVHGGEVEWGEVVGVVGDVQSFFADRVVRVATWQVYRPVAQAPRASFEIAVRTAGVAPATAVASVRAAILAVDPDLPVRQLQPAEQTVAAALGQWEFLLTMLSYLALLGLAMASLGLYGVISRMMAQRRREFGIRLAVGALASDIVRLGLSTGGRLVAVGAALGLLGAVGISQLILKLFPGIETQGFLVMTAVTAILGGVALLACWLPARAASRVDLVSTLWAE